MDKDKIEPHKLLVRDRIKIARGDKNQSQFAAKLGLNHQLVISQLERGTRKVNADLAIRLENAGFATALEWLNWQAVEDLEQARRESSLQDWINAK